MNQINKRRKEIYLNACKSIRKRKRKIKWSSKLNFLNMYINLFKVVDNKVQL
jgi:hypothetical protein